ncbi:MAG TPA: hypothetical protein DEQ61_00735 [Streptomyces sp.]|nr:hypothetical protein [Streptomyces sp.]
MNCSSPTDACTGASSPGRPRPRAGGLWHVNVQVHQGGRGWHQTFGPDTPAQAIAGFPALIAFSTARPLSSPIAPAQEASCRNTSPLAGCCTSSRPPTPTFPHTSPSTRTGPTPTTSAASS